MENRFFKGQLKRWNDNRGFGFISAKNEQKDIFIHISALKNMNRRPVAGDVIYYQIQTENDGKKRAVNARIEGVAPVKPRLKRTSVKTNNKWFAKLFLLALLISIGFVIYK